MTVTRFLANEMRVHVASDIREPQLAAHGAPFHTAARTPHAGLARDGLDLDSSRGIRYLHVAAHRLCVDIAATVSAHVARYSLRHDARRLRDRHLVVCVTQLSAVGAYAERDA